MVQFWFSIEEGAVSVKWRGGGERIGGAVKNTLIGEGKLYSLSCSATYKAVKNLMLIPADYTC